MFYIFLIKKFKIFKIMDLKQLLIWYIKNKDK